MAAVNQFVQHLTKTRRNALTTQGGRGTTSQDDDDAPVNNADLPEPPVTCVSSEHGHTAGLLWIPEVSEWAQATCLKVALRKFDKNPLSKVN